MKQIVFARFVLAAALWVGGFGCSTAQNSAPRADSASKGDSTQPVAANLAQETSLQFDRKIAPEDLLEIEIVGEKDLPKIYQVPAGGEISVPYLDKPVKVSGKTTLEVKRELEELWKVNIFVNPQVLVRVGKYRERFITVQGKVNRPGSIPLPAEQRIDILTAIANAGDLSPLANENKIEFTRVGQKPRIFKLKELRKITDPAKKIFLEPEDKIYVYESTF